MDDKPLLLPTTAKGHECRDMIEVLRSLEASEAQVLDAVLRFWTGSGIKPDLPAKPKENNPA